MNFSSRCTECGAVSTSDGLLSHALGCTAFQLQGVEGAGIMLGDQVDHQHGPRFGCNYNGCGNPNSSARCPFVKDSPLLSTGDNGPELVIPVPCRHEWRQYWVSLPDTVATEARYMPADFYCIHCLTIRPLPDVA